MRFSFSHFLRLFSNDENTSFYLRPWFNPNESKAEINENARRAFESVIFIRQRLLTGQLFDDLTENIYQFAKSRNQLDLFDNRKVKSFHF